MTRQRGRSWLMAAGLWALAAAGARGSELAVDPSFEHGNGAKGGWRRDCRAYSIDTKVSHGGKSSLRFFATEQDGYPFCSQKVALRPGWKVRLGVWVKTKDLQGRESGATICMEWSSAEGKHLGGSYPSGVKGTCDWTHIESTCRVPDSAASVTLSCYVRRGMTGTGSGRSGRRAAQGSAAQATRSAAQGSDLYFQL